MEPRVEVPIPMAPDPSGVVEAVDMVNMDEVATAPVEVANVNAFSVSFTMVEVAWFE